MSASNGKANGKPKSQLSVTELELQFAQNPESSAYVDLCEAYLDQGRFMEAMVVCKKGIKAHPDSVDAKILLASVYGRQKKYKRALTELDKLIEKSPEHAVARLARGRVRIESGDGDGAVDDLKKALDLDGTLSEATELLSTKGIVYPEPEPEPEPPPPPPVPQRRSAVSVTGVPAGAPPPMPSETSDTADVEPQDIVGGHVAQAQITSHPSNAPISGFTAQERAQSFARVDPNMRVAPVKLEGEEELEALARVVAEEKEDRGKPKTTLFLFFGLLLIGITTIITVVLNKREVEAIDGLTSTSLKAFNRDTYGSYKKASGDLEEIVEDWDAKHALTLARLAHTYAILWGEHGDGDLEKKLQGTLFEAAKHAPDVSHTVAAQALYTLYSGDDRQASAKKAHAMVEPWVRKHHEAGAAPTHADLVLGIVELHMGDYEAANKRLSTVSQVLPGSVRAKVWHARAAFRSKRMGTAQGVYQASLRAEPGHPGAMAGLALTYLERGLAGAAGEQLLAFDKYAEKHSKEISRPDAALAEFARSELFRTAGEEDRGRGAYENARRLDPKNADFPFGLGRWLLKNDRSKEALEPLALAVKMEPTRFTFLVELAEAQMRQKHFAEAEKLIEQALDRAPDRVDSLLTKARLLRRKGDKGAEAYIQAVLKEHPSFKVLINLELGRLYRSEKRYDEAVKVFEEGAIANMSSYPHLLQGEVLVSYGRLQEDMGNVVVATNAYEKAGQFGELEGWYRLIYSSRGNDREKMKIACEKVLTAGQSRFLESARGVCQ